METGEPEKIFFFFIFSKAGSREGWWLLWELKGTQ
jgi:hypothetical protein